MNGRIKSLSRTARSGFIRAETGLNVHFDSSAVLALGPAELVVGELVTFDLDGSKWATAVNIRGAAQLQTVPTTRQAAATTYLQYMGFEQTGTIRAYRFKRFSCGEQAREFTVNADMMLFTKHRVRIQEGPAMCSRLLCAGHDSSVRASWPPSQWLSEADMVAHVAKQPPADTKHGHKRKLDT